jgi:hypothetical protein
MSDKIDMIYDLLKQDREESSDFRKEVRESHKNTGERLVDLEASSQVQNQQLATHMRRTEILENLHGVNVGRIEVNEVKIEELEKPRIVLSGIKKIVIGLGAIAGACIAIAKAFGMF